MTSPNEPKYPENPPQRKPKSKAVAIALAVFLGGFCWVYTFRRDWPKFIGCILATYALIFLFLPHVHPSSRAAFVNAMPMVMFWLVPLLDSIVKPSSWYRNYPRGHADEPAEEKPVRPRKVSTAVGLLYIALAVGCIGSLIEAPSVSERMSLPLRLGLMFVGLAILWLFIYTIGVGRNWARVVLLVFVSVSIIGIALEVLGAGPALHSMMLNAGIPPEAANGVLVYQPAFGNPISGLMRISQMVLQVIAVVLLFQKPSSEWFKQLKRWG